METKFMPEDLLAPFRRAGSAAPSPPSSEKPSTYRAFAVAGGGSAKPQRLELHPKDGLTVARLYSALTEIAYDRADYTGILLVFAAGKMVKIRGRDLRPVADALVAGTCEYLAELDGEMPSQGAPVIESLELVNAQPKPAATP